MDALCDPDIHTAVLMSGTQVGKTECGLNLVGCVIDQDPGPFLAVFPTARDGDAAVWSTRRFAPMVRDTPCLRARIGPGRAKDGGNTVLEKTFPGGYLACVGSNAPAQLSARPIRWLLLEEIDKYPISAGVEGDPQKLAARRQDTFWNRKTFKSGTPTIKGRSAIARAFEGSDQRHYYVPCYDCGRKQQLTMDRVRWDRTADGNHLPQTARYECERCGARWNDVQRWLAIGRGEWRADRPCRGIAGFHLWEAYSTFATLEKIVTDFLDSKDDPEELKAWVNTCKGETWEERGATVAGEGILARREPYGISPLPPEVAVITCGVDVQEDRLEAEVVGWGPRGQSWGIEYWKIWGAPTKPDVWAELTRRLRTRYRHPSGTWLHISRTAIDSGDQTSEVYVYCASKFPLVFPVKGQGQPGLPILREGQRTGGTRSKASSRFRSGSTRLYIVGTDTAKDRLYLRLGLTDPEAFGYCHFPETYTETYFAQVTAEKRVTKYRQGRPEEIWTNPGKKRNEALDCRVYAMAAFEHLNLSTDRLDAMVVTINEGTGQPKPQERAQVRVRSTKHRWLESR